MASNLAIRRQLDGLGTLFRGNLGLGPPSNELLGSRHPPPTHPHPVLSNCQISCIGSKKVPEARVNSSVSPTTKTAVAPKQHVYRPRSTACLTASRDYPI